jgi:hypothetical protein
MSHSRIWIYVRFEVLTAVKMQIFVFLVETPCGFVGRYQRFGGTYYIYLNPEDGGSMFLWNVGIYLQVHRA